jgi:hypothetical protein
MKNSELKKLIDKYIDPEVKERFTLRKNVLYQIQESDFIKGFCFEQSTFDKEGFYLWCFIQPLYVPTEDLVLTYGKRLSSNKIEFWVIKKENESQIKNTFKEINSILKNEGILYLEELGTLEKFYLFCKEHRKINVRIWEALVYTGYYLNIPEARNDAELLLDHIKQLNFEFPWLKVLFENLRTLISISALERKKLLIKNKEYTINHLQLKSNYTSDPFIFQ